MHQAQPSNPATHPALADPPKRPVVGVYLCRASGCGRPNVSYDDGPPKQCKNDRCSKVYKDVVTGVPEGSTREWLKCRDTKNEEPRFEKGKLVVPPSAVETIPAPPEEEPPPVRIGGSETRVSDEAIRDIVARPVTAEDYRHEWVAERVASMSDKAPFGTPVATADLWGWAEALYDEGKRRGHLP
jgi:hypothetical protein